MSTSAVVAKANIPAGTTGQAMISSGLVAIELIPTKSYTPTDLGSLSGLSDEVLTSAVTKGHAISSTELTASTSSISLPTGMDAVTVTLTGTNGAGRLPAAGRPSRRLRQHHQALDGGLRRLRADLPMPCTELAMANIEVLDVAEHGAGLRRATRHAAGTRRSRPRRRCSWR